MVSKRCVSVNGPVIVGAGPSGLAVAAGLKDQGVPFKILERDDCIASLWQKRTYDRLKLHLPKLFCQLPELPFPDHYPEYPSKKHFVEYLESYAAHFDINPNFNEHVQSAKYDEACGLWRVRTVSTTDGGEVEYICQSVVVASGEHAEPTVPDFEGLKDFRGKVIHTRDYKSGQRFRGEKVLVVGCGISGMEVCLDLCHHHAKPLMVVRSSVLMLPREMQIFESVRSSETKLVPEIIRFYCDSVQLADGQTLPIDSVVLATGYHSNVPCWLQENDFFSDNGLPKKAFPDGWKGKDGLYAVGFTMRGIRGACYDAIRVSKHIVDYWKMS